MAERILDGRVAIITGAAQGMGRAAAVMFAASGAKVLVADINDAEGASTVATIRDAGGEGFFVHTDVSLAKDAERMANAALERWGTIDVLYNNAAATVLTNTKDRPVHELEEAVWDKIHAVSLKSVFLCSKYCLPTMIAKKKGCIINMTSIDAIVAEPGFDAYTAAKGGVISMTRCMAGEYGQYNIRVNAISPGYVITECQLPWYTTQPKMVAAANAVHALQRCGKPEEVAEVALFLASDRASFMTGSIVSVDGGFTAFKQTLAEELCR